MIRILCGKAADILFPRRCALCHDIVMPKGGSVCAACNKHIQVITEPRCKKCGKQIQNPQKEVCVDCARTPKAFTQGIAVFPYNSRMQSSILYYKEGGRREYAEFYVQAALRYAHETIRRWRPQIVLPVPVHASALRKRGFNPAALLARRMASQMQLPYAENYLCRKATRRQQKSLGRDQRKRNLRKAFCLGKGFQRCERVLLIDDVYTTGSTMEALSRLLKQAGVSEIYFLVLCSGEQGGT
ncbi:MAG: ComF family protein [Lachnospiraceae bacterium]